MVDKTEIIVEFGSRAELEREFEENLRHGGAFAKCRKALDTGDSCELVLVHPDNKRRMALPASVVWVAMDAEVAGVGLEVDGFSADVRERLLSFIQDSCAVFQDDVDLVDQEHGRFREGDQTSLPADDPAVLPEGEEDLSSPEIKDKQTHIRERLRGLSVAEQQKVARGGDLNARIALERIYGKMVWEALLRNSQVTIPEVARIARMGALPKPLLELICSNATWVRAPHVRRALLGNPKIGSVLLDKVLRMTPRSELKLIPKQTAYSPGVRAAARKLLKS